MGSVMNSFQSKSSSFKCKKAGWSIVVAGDSVRVVKPGMILYVK